jgi:hypothetical protein
MMMVAKHFSVDAPEGSPTFWMGGADEVDPRR